MLHNHLSLIFHDFKMPISKASIIQQPAKTIFHSLSDARLDRFHCISIFFDFYVISIACMTKLHTFEKLQILNRRMNDSNHYGRKIRKVVS